MLAEVFFYGILVYIAYKVIFGFIVPVAVAGKQMKQQFRNMQDNMQQQAGQFHQEDRQPGKSSSQKTSRAGDYIDFEDIKS